jgi:hypothetical protein
MTFGRKVLRALPIKPVPPVIQIVAIKSLLFSGIVMQFNF